MSADSIEPQLKHYNFEILPCIETGWIQLDNQE